LCVVGVQKILSVSYWYTRQEQTDHHRYGQLVTTGSTKRSIRHTILGCDKLTV